ncbi:conserved Plasmodium protein, unknown function [Plasmodium yoelii]|uniref:Uncharacterized protein n=2 Tax=Plasmodium yoelii TaxID=5861 RepID=A0AAF0B213_PLAYO|nr:conserved Plasmodium protein, unknown function [Plasmodium yoelii]WBY56953.1 hypothetical protein Py17XNL_000801944 [Plasmodium yoelii yoelii]CDU17750.1 conserved Plasmodium protein, unknown function [Plasmodium yoelii]VTZ77780.1 conserved Plasmodium protein, unknown function [Plasmodium yoelii]|eukprot:XP_022812061.1 conserved Plasmodium protein, unknown function [Plasmodium yoelii]
MENKNNINFIPSSNKEITNSLDISLPNLILSKISKYAKQINCYTNNSIFGINENNKINSNYFSCRPKNYYSLIKIKSNISYSFKNVCNQNCCKKKYDNIYNLIKTKSIKSKLFKLDRNKINYFKKKREKEKNIFYKKKKFYFNKKHQKNSRNYNYLSCIHLKKKSDVEYYFPSESQNDYMIYDKNDKRDKIKYTNHFQLFEYNKSEEIDKQKYINSISRSIKKQKKKMYLLEKNACRILDIIELLLYKRMDEIFTLKQNMSNHDKYKEICPDIFYFDNNDDLIETMDKKLKFLPKIPVIKNLVPYFGPSPENIFGKYYSLYKYNYKIIDIRLKIYKIPNLFNPFTFCNHIRFNTCDQNRQNCKINLQKYYYFFTHTNFRKACKIKSEKLATSEKLAKSTKLAKPNSKTSFLNLIPNSNKSIIPNSQIDFIRIDKIPPDLIQILNYKILELSKKRESTIHLSAS